MNIMFDISKLAVSQDSFTLLLTAPVTNKELNLEFGKHIADGAGGFLSVDILSSDTNIMKKALASAMKTAREAAKGDHELTDREIYLIQCRALATATTGASLGGNFKHSEDAFFDLVSNPEFTWVKDQVMFGMDSRGNFIKS